MGLNMSKSVMLIHRDYCVSACHTRLSLSLLSKVDLVIFYHFLAEKNF